MIIVNTGNGKGKTTAALGLALRAWGQGMRVLILQFIKGNCHYGELDALRALPPGRIEIAKLGRGFTRRDTGVTKEEHLKAIKNGLQRARQEIKSGRWDMIILDEINYALKFGLVEKEEVLSLLREKPEKLHIVLTGRDAAPEVVKIADLVTEMKEIKHPFQKGVKAQKGIEF